MARPEKVAQVEEIRERITSSGAAVITEYRGLTVTEIARLRASLRDAGTTYKIYKNTLARRAVEGTDLAELTDLLVGPTAWAFVEGDVVGAAKAIRDFARTNDALVIKGGLLEGQVVSAEQVAEIAALPGREELLAKMAGAFQAPLVKAAGLFSALQRKTAYAVKALIEKRVEGGEALPEPEPAEEAEDEAAPVVEEATEATESAAPEAGEADAPAAEEAEEAPAAEDESE